MFWVLSLLATTSKIQIISHSVTYKHVCFYARPSRIMSRNSLQVCILKFIRIILFIFICSMSTKVICKCERSLIRNNVSQFLASHFGSILDYGSTHGHPFILHDERTWKTTEIFSNSFSFTQNDVRAFVRMHQECIVILTFRKLK